MGSGSTHTLITPTMIAKEALMLLKNNLVMGSQVHRAYDAEFPGAPKKGGAVQIRKPVKFRVTKARTRATSTITEQYITLTLATQAHVSWSFNTADLTLTIEQYSERYIRPAASVLANTIDADLCGLYDDVFNVVHESTGFVTPNTFMCLGQAMQRLDEEAVPPDERVIVFNPAAHWSMANALSNMYYKEAGEAALRKGYLGKIANCEVFMDQNIKSHTVGRWATDTAAGTTGRLVVHSSAASGAGGGLPTGNAVNATQNQNILVCGFAQTTGAYNLQVGDTFTINNVYAVNPMSGESTGSLRRFVVSTAAVGSTDSTAQPAFVYFRPEMIHTGPYKTVTTIPALGSKVWVDESPLGVYPQNLAFHKNAFALVMAPLEAPQGAWGSTVTEDGFSIRVVKDYDIDVDDEIIRLDILYGVSTIYPELACRISGALGG